MTTGVGCNICTQPDTVTAILGSYYLVIVSYCKPKQLDTIHRYPFRLLSFSFIKMSGPINPNLHANSTPAVQNAITTGVSLQNQAMEAEKTGDYDRAESLFLEAISIKEAVFGTQAIQLALSRNSLGELYMKMDRLGEAEHNLKLAVEVRNGAGSHLDAAVSRDNLAQLFEMRGKLEDAKNMRLNGAPDNMVCSNYKCPGQVFRLSQLRACSACKVYVVPS
jgi:tetratricopeptide (TPR) repeat protein